MNKNRFHHLIPAVSIALIALASCTSAGGLSGGSYSSSSSEGFVWASSYSSSAPTVSVASGCMVGGCSSEICADEGSDPIVSACIYKEEFACYKSARCEKQAGGSCGWTRTDELLTCLETAKK